jgi:hypothetical protein
LSGRLPFEENTTAATLNAILTRPAPDLTRLRDDLPEPLVNLIFQMLEKDRERRIASVRLVGAELEALIRGLDTPLRGLVMGTDGEPASRFSTPPEDDPGHVPAMVRRTPGQSHGFSVYPTPSESPTRPPSYGGVYYSDGTPISEEIIRAATNKWRWISAMVIVSVLALAGVVLVALLTQSGWPNGGDNGDGDGETAFLVSLATAAASQSAVVQPVEPGEYMVLVAAFQPLNGAEGLPHSLVVDDLTESLEIGIPYSRVRVRAYPGVITSGEEAQRAARANAATLVIWGSFTPDAFDVQVQAGVMDAFDTLQFDPDLLARMANVHVTLSDVRTETVAPHVLAVLSVLQGADGDIYEFMRTLAMTAEIDAPVAEVAGQGVSDHVHRFFALYEQDVEEAIAEITAARRGLPASGPV